MIFINFTTYLNANTTNFNTLGRKSPVTIDTNIATTVMAALSYRTLISTHSPNPGITGTMVQVLQPLWGEYIYISISSISSMSSISYILSISSMSFISAIYIYLSISIYIFDTDTHNLSISEKFILGCQHYCYKCSYSTKLFLELWAIIHYKQHDTHKIKAPF